MLHIQQFVGVPMIKFHKILKELGGPSRELSKDELDAKHVAALEAKSIVSWKSPERVYKARSTAYFYKVGIYGLVASLGAIALGWYLLVGVIIALIFVAFVLSLAAPETIEHRITNLGMVSGGRPYLWEELDSFWFEKRGEDRLLVIQTLKRFPARLIMLLSNVSERTLLEILEKRIDYHQAPVRTMYDKWANALQKRINLD